ncbi:MAG: hypothetical protein L6R37_007144 [Teloschistes peruensis]|nr:MAG: hypothetical protein L6R37_007144 [Teloschistes peruensis]
MWSPAPLHPNSPHFPSASSPSGPLFSPSLLPSLSSLPSAPTLPKDYTLRPLQRSDYNSGLLDVLRVLTTVGEISKERWDERYDWMARRGDEYFVVVVCDGEGRCVGTGCVVVERKMYVFAYPMPWRNIHNLGLVGHIEDIAVAKDQQGKKLGLLLIQTLDHIAQKVGCYKLTTQTPPIQTILDCSDANEGFYLKCGFKRAGLEMAHYYDKK